MENAVKEPCRILASLRFPQPATTSWKTPGRVFLSPLENRSRGATPGRWSAGTGFPQIHNLDDDEFL